MREVCRYLIGIAIGYAMCAANKYERGVIPESELWLSTVTVVLLFSSILAVRFVWGFLRCAK